jgi:23S rRNA pseudouridine1911/1915/1917 synthase
MHASMDFVWPPSMPRDAIPVVLTVIRERSGMRLDKYLTIEMPRLSRTRAAKIADEYAFSAAGVRLAPSKKVRTGDVIVLFRPAWEEPDAPRDVPIVYEDDAILAVNKPAGLPVHPTAKFHRNTLTSILAERFPNERVALCHRLDKETSGVLVAARTREAEITLKNAFAGRDVHKTYHAIVHGTVEQDAFLIDAAMALAGGDELSVLMQVRDERDGGLPSRTRIRVIERLAGFTVVEASPETGRQHQIRVHLAHAGHPIVGDKLYAHSPAMFIAALNDELTEEMRLSLRLARHALHAARISFVHPTRRDAITIEAQTPDDMTSFAREHRIPG